MLFIASDSSHMKATKREYCKKFQLTEHPELIHACIMVDKDTETNFYPPHFIPYQRPRKIKT